MQIIEKIKQGKVGVIPTDTLYGLVGSAFSKEAVEKIYHLKQRDPKKAFIILIGSIKDLALFGISSENKLLKNWPEKTSIILPCDKKEFFYLHRGLNSLAFRLPKKESLVDFLKKTGPLVAPSCNKEKENPAKTIKEAKQYFPHLDFYINGGELKERPSKLIKLENNKVIIIRNA